MTPRANIIWWILLIGLSIALVCVVRAQPLPPFPVADEDTGPSILTNHVCPARLPVIFLSWNAPTNWQPKAYRVYATTNPATELTNYAFYAEVPRTNLVVLTLGKSQEFFCVSAVAADGRETKRATK